TAVAAVDGPHDKLRGSLLFDGPLVRALGRPNRDQVITRREALATALQAIELTNGSTLHDLMTRGSAYWLKKCGGDRRVLADEVYRRALGRLPVESERDV